MVKINVSEIVLTLKNNKISVNIVLCYRTVGHVFKKKVNIAKILTFHLIEGCH